MVIDLSIKYHCIHGAYTGDRMITGLFNAIYWLPLHIYHFCKKKKVNNIQLFIKNYIFFFFTICLTVFLTLSAVNKPPFRKVYLLREWAIKKFLKKSQSTNLSKSISNGQKKNLFFVHFSPNIFEWIYVKKCEKSVFFTFTSFLFFLLLKFSKFPFFLF